MDTPGLSFSLFGDSKNNQSPNTSNGATTPQEAIRVLSLHLPKVVGAYAPIPGQLLNAPGSAGFGGAPTGAPNAPNLGIEEFLRRLFGRMPGPDSMAPPSLPQPSMGAPSSPSPGSFSPSMSAPPMGAPSMKSPDMGSGSAPSMGGSAPPPNFVPGIGGGQPLPDPIESVYRPPTNQDLAPTPPATEPPVGRSWQEERPRRV